MKNSRTRVPNDGPPFAEGVQCILNSVGIALAKFDHAMRL
jgi:hypothetical protein